MIGEIALVAGAAFVSSLVSGLGGFGGAFIIVIALTPVVGAKAVIPLIAVFAIFGNASRVIFYRRTIDWNIAVKFILASLPGVYVGANFLAAIPERWLLAFLGAVLVSAVPVRRWLRSRSFEPGLKTIAGIGLLYGFVSGSAAGSGMFVIAGLSGMGLQGPLLLGTDAVIGLVNAVSRAGAFWSLDLLNRDLALLGAAMGLATFPGTWIASRIVHAMGVRLHNMLIEALIVCGGIWFVYRAAVSGPAPSG